MGIHSVGSQLYVCMTQFEDLHPRVVILVLISDLVLFFCFRLLAVVNFTLVGCAMITKKHIRWTVSRSWKSSVLSANVFRRYVNYTILYYAYINMSNIKPQL